MKTYSGNFGASYLDVKLNGVWVNIHDGVNGSSSAVWVWDEFAIGSEYGGEFISGIRYGFDEVAPFLGHEFIVDAHRLSNFMYCAP